MTLSSMGLSISRELDSQAYLSTQEQSSRPRVSGPCEPVCRIIFWIGRIDRSKTSSRSRRGRRGMDWCSRTCLSRTSAIWKRCAVAYSHFFRASKTFGGLPWLGGRNEHSWSLTLQETQVNNALQVTA